MKIILTATPQQGALLAARIFIAQLQRQPASVLGLATGSTPIPLYRELVQAHVRGVLSFSRVQCFNLDEYVGLPPEHPQSYQYFMRAHLFKHVDIPATNYHLPDGMAPNLAMEVQAYERAIVAAGGIDMQLLGIGQNGHIGFNEPGCALDGRTHVEDLTQQTINDNARLFFNNDIAAVPKRALTMGVGTIMDARQCVLLAFGHNKAKVIAGMLEGPITNNNPASILQKHPNVHVIVDAAAAALIQKRTLITTEPS